ncbi:MAG: phosphate/phosphite/phosphonate ABC transporter substrate-binding protein [Campylobacterota bacterium]|nr:phosphate/phosphite/phosphonate ABC transporter substrate-binding protein [Campylobacterota bacterium]
MFKKLVMLSLLVIGMFAQAQSYKFAITDLEGMEELQREFGEFKRVLENKSGDTFDFFPVPNRTAAVEAMKSKKVDFVLTGPAEYVVFKKLTGAKQVVGFGRPDYFAAVIVMADSGIGSIKDLKGKKVALGSVGSTSKHLAPMQIMTDYGLNPLKDIKALHTNYKIQWKALKRGDISAIGITNDKFMKFRAAEKELEPASFKVLARSMDLPNDVLLAGNHISDKFVKKLKNIFVNNEEELAKAMLAGEDNKKYKGMRFIANVKDSDYNYVRSMYKTIGYPEFSNFVGN